MQVNPDALRAWAKWLDGLSGEIRGLADGFGTAATADPFPGTTLATAVYAVRDEVKSSLVSFSGRTAEMAQIARGIGGGYEIEDNDFALRLRAMGGLP
ncbi:hypothetical protein [Nocardia blacklockiae]|uniref:hypothetical protein n=1 Tax=Nocardia blacklockiae TaxID=480036 RepID=UPI00189492E2|nr:hypothetical protein [Nocardia blacklockiae]MBF6174921.1 hypothetical protein [Nocardia blacklockiae]